jgi:hypothetical protein
MQHALGIEAACNGLARDEARFRQTHALWQTGARSKEGERKGCAEPYRSGSMLPFNARPRASTSR